MIFNLPSLTDEILLRDLGLLGGVGADQITYYPLMVSPRSNGRSRRRSARSTTPARSASTGSSRARSRDPPADVGVGVLARPSRLIDEYIVDHDEYVGIGSGSFSYLGGEIYANTFSLRAYREAIEAGSARRSTPACACCGATSSATG
jgi:menaquinone C8-methyltransferase